jgi:beta-lactamase superfamily II metal-dependent hydrolase
VASITQITQRAAYRGTPGEDVVEVNLFGPGYGESVLVHLGHSRWLVVDSCAPSDEAQPAALSYLDSIGVDSGRDVKYIVATHWHDDHVRGFSRIINACPAADVFLSDALTHKPLMRFVKANAPRHVTNLREMNRAIETLLSRRRDEGPPYSFLGENKAVHSSLHHPSNDVEIWALSPSSVDVQQALRGLRYYLEGDSMYSLPAIPNPRENHASIVLHVRVGSQRLLLGADREKRTNAGQGWASVATCAARRDLKPATLLKVAHHGSPNGDSDVIWRDLLEADPIALLAPFRRGHEGGRPRAEDVASLCGRTRWAFTTSAAGDSDEERVESAEIESEAEAAMGIEEIEPAQLPLGHIRARAQASGGPWSVELIRPAAYLCKDND